MAGFEANFFAIDPHALHIGAQIQDVTIGGEEGRILAGLNRTESIGNSCQLRWIEGQALEGFGLRQPESNRLGSGVGKISSQWRLHGGEAKAESHLDSGLVQNSRSFEMNVIRL